MSREARITGAVLHLLVGLAALVSGGAIFVIAAFLVPIVLVSLIEQFIPLLGASGSGYGLITAAIILALMVLPIMAAMIRDLLLNVPEGIIEGSIALGATMWQTVARVALSSIGAGMVGAMRLALGRAFGETPAGARAALIADGSGPHLQSGEARV